MHGRPKRLSRTELHETKWSEMCWKVIFNVFKPPVATTSRKRLPLFSDYLSSAIFEISCKPPRPLLVWEKVWNFFLVLTSSKRSLDRVERKFHSRFCTREGKFSMWTIGFHSWNWLITWMKHIKHGVSACSYHLQLPYSNEAKFWTNMVQALVKETTWVWHFGWLKGISTLYVSVFNRWFIAQMFSALPAVFLFFWAFVCSVLSRLVVHSFTCSFGFIEFKNKRTVKQQKRVQWFSTRAL